MTLAAAYRDAFTDAHRGRDVLPANSTQRRFALAAESSGRRILVPYAYRTRPGALSEEDLRFRLATVAAHHPALRCRVDQDDAGLVVQQVQPVLVPPCTVLAAEGEGAERDAVRAVLVDAERAVEPCPVRAALLRGATADRLLLVFDHTVVDETSLGLVTRDLFADHPPATSVDYEAAVWRWLDLEIAAAAGTGYWVDRLAAVARADGGAAHTTSASAVVVDTEPLPVPDVRRRATLFPRLVAATHAALLATGRDPSTVIYPWAARPAGMADVVGCFMNTVYSGATGSPDWRAVTSAVWPDLEHGHVPFDDVVLAVNRRVRTGWSGTAHCLLGFEDVTGRTPPGRPEWTVREWLPPWLAPKCPVNMVARYDGGVLALRVVADPDHVPAGDAAELADTWRERVAAHLSR